MTDSDVFPMPREGQDNVLSAAIHAIHASGGMEVLTDQLAHFSDVEAALEPLLSALFQVAADGALPDLEEVNAELGLLESVTGFNPGTRAWRYLERAVEDGQAYREVTTKAVLVSEAARHAAASRAEWCKWEAQVDDDLSPGAVNMDVDGTARHIARQWLKSDPRVVPAEAALHAVLGFRAAELPMSRSIWRYALDGARAGFEDHQARLEADARQRSYNAERLAAAFAGGAE